MNWSGGSGKRKDTYKEEKFTGLGKQLDMGMREATIMTPKF